MSIHPCLFWKQNVAFLEGDRGNVNIAAVLYLETHTATIGNIMNFKKKNKPN